MTSTGKLLFRALFVTILLGSWCSQVGCGVPTTTDDAGTGQGAYAPRSTAFGGPLAPQGGTVTSVQPTTGGGLAGGGTSGVVSLGLLTSCSPSQVLQWSGTAWACGTAGGLSGLTTNTIPKATSSTTIGNGTITDNAGVVSTASDISQTKTTATSWLLTTRGTPSTFPVPVIQPTQATTVLAFDLMPKGAPTIGTGGYAWEDICDADLIANSAAATHCIRMGMGGTANLDSIILNGATQANLTLSINGTAVETVASNSVTINQPFALTLTSGTALAITENQNAGTFATITNTSAGVGAFSKVSLSNDASTGAMEMYAMGSAWTTAGAFIQDGGVLYAGAGLGGGMNVVTAAAAPIRFYAGGTAAGNLAMTINSGTPGGVAIAGTATADGGLRVFDVAGTGLTSSTNTVSLNINAGVTQTCGAGTAVTVLSGTGITTCTAFGTSSLTNSAGNNVLPKSNGTNLIASSASDDATTFAINTNKFTVTEASGNTAVAGTLGVTGASTLSTTTINGQGLTATTNNNWAVFGQFTNTAVTATNRGAVEAQNTGTFNTATGALVTYAMFATNGAIVSSGANGLTDYGVAGSATGAGTGVTNIGVYATASGGTVANYAFYSDAGNNVFNNTSGTSTFFGDVFVNSGHALTVTSSATLNSTGGKTIIGASFAPTGDQLTVNMGGAAGANSFNAETISNTSSADTTAAGRITNGISATCTNTVAAGANILVSRCGYFTNTSTAGGTLVPYALYTDSADNYFNATSGKSTFGGNLLVNSNTTLGNAVTDINTFNGHTYAAGSLDGYDGIYAGLAQDFGDMLQVSKVRKNWSYDSDALGTGSVSSNLDWYAATYGSTTAYTTSTQTSPRGLSETVGVLTCTSGGTACSAGGSDWRMVDTSTSTGVVDLRSQTVTFSVWEKLASGTGSTTIQVARYNDGDSHNAACAVNSTTWTRCSVTATFNSTALTDNSEIRAYILTDTTTALYVYAAQLEQHNDPTPYQRTDANLDTTVSSTTLTAFAPMMRFGTTMQDPDVLIRYFDNTNTFYGVKANAPGGTVCREGETCTGVTTGYGVYGATTGTTTNFAGVFGASGGGNSWAGDFSGNLRVQTGNTLYTDTITPAASGGNLNLTTISSGAMILTAPGGISTASTLTTGAGLTTIGSGGLTTGSGLTTIGAGGINTTAGAFALGEVDDSFGTQTNGSGTLTDVSWDRTKRGTMWTTGAIILDGMGFTVGTPTAGQQFMLCDLGSSVLTIKHENAGETTAGRRFHNPSAQDIGITNGQCVDFVYDGAATRWYPVGSVASGYGGTANVIPKYSGTNGFTNSAISDNGTVVSDTEGMNICTGCVNSSGITSSNSSVNAGATAGTLSLGTANTGGITIGQATNPTVIASALTTLGTATTTAHVKFADTTARPTVANCGTTPTVVGNDTAGFFTTTATPTAACALTFNTAFSSNVDCELWAMNSNVPTTAQYTVGTGGVTAITASGGGALAAGIKIHWLCYDH